MEMLEIVLHENYFKVNSIFSGEDLPWVLMSDFENRVVYPHEFDSQKKQIVKWVGMRQ